MEDKKGENILLIDIRGLTVFADYFVICSGTSERMLQALADAVSEVVHRNYQLPARLEGKAGDGWMLVDIGDVVVHLFSPFKRQYYLLEELWSQGKVLLHVQ